MIGSARLSAGCEEPCLYPALTLGRAGMSCPNLSLVDQPPPHHPMSVSLEPNPKAWRVAMDAQKWCGRAVRCTCNAQSKLSRNGEGPAPASGGGLVVVLGRGCVPGLTRGGPVHLHAQFKPSRHGEGPAPASGGGLVVVLGASASAAPHDGSWPRWPVAMTRPWPGLHCCGGTPPTTATATPPPGSVTAASAPKCAGLSPLSGVKASSGAASVGWCGAMSWGWSWLWMGGVRGEMLAQYR